MKREMRRQDRQVRDADVIKSVLSEARILHLGLVDDGQVYVVPLNYGWREENGEYTLFAHSAAAGRKIELIGSGAEVGFEMECGIEYFDADTACGWGNRYKSIIGEGRATLCQSAEEKRLGLSAIMAHYSQRRDFTFAEEMVNSTQVIEINVKELSCKIHE